MPVLTETRHAGEFIVSEANGARSREQIVIADGEGVLVAGTVLGRILVDDADVTADAGNAEGTGTIGSVTVGAGAKRGDYRATCIEPASSAGKFLVTDPDGIEIGVATVGVAFSGGGLGFTIADGNPDFVSGEGFTITVNAGSGEYVALDLAHTKGGAVAAAILWGGVDATDAAQDAVAIRRDAEVNLSELTWPAGITTDEKSAALDQLAALGIFAR